MNPSSLPRWLSGHTSFDDFWGNFFRQSSDMETACALANEVLPDDGWPGAFSPNLCRRTASSNTPSPANRLLLDSPYKYAAFQNLVQDMMRSLEAGVYSSSNSNVGQADDMPRDDLIQQPQAGALEISSPLFRSRRDLELLRPSRRHETLTSRPPGVTRQTNLGSSSLYAGYEQDGQPLRSSLQHRSLHSHSASLRCRQVHAGPGHEGQAGPDLCHQQHCRKPPQSAGSGLVPPYEYEATNVLPLNELYRDYGELDGGKEQLHNNQHGPSRGQHPSEDNGGHDLVALSPRHDPAPENHRGHPDNLSDATISRICPGSAGQTYPSSKSSGKRFTPRSANNMGEPPLYHQLYGTAMVIFNDMHLGSMKMPPGRVAFCPGDQRPTVEGASGNLSTAFGMISGRSDGTHQTFPLTRPMYNRRRLASTPVVPDDQDHLDRRSSPTSCRALGCLEATDDSQEGLIIPRPKGVKLDRQSRAVVAGFPDPGPSCRVTGWPKPKVTRGENVALCYGEDMEEEEHVEPKRDCGQQIKSQLPTSDSYKMVVHPAAGRGKVKREQQHLLDPLAVFVPRQPRTNLYIRAGESSFVQGRRQRTGAESAPVTAVKCSQPPLSSLTSPCPPSRDVAVQASLGGSPHCEASKVPLGGKVCQEDGVSGPVHAPPSHAETIAVAKPSDATHACKIDPQAHTTYLSQDENQTGPTSCVIDGKGPVKVEPTPSGKDTVKTLEEVAAGRGTRGSKSALGSDSPGLPMSVVHEGPPRHGSSDQSIKTCIKHKRLRSSDDVSIPGGAVEVGAELVGISKDQQHPSERPHESPRNSSELKEVKEARLVGMQKAGASKATLPAADLLPKRKEKKTKLADRVPGCEVTPAKTHEQSAAHDIPSQPTSPPRDGLTLAQRIRREKLMWKILVYIGEQRVFERDIRQTFGNNPDTSKALRAMASSGQLVRLGKGGRKYPFSYHLTATALQRLRTADTPSDDAVPQVRDQGGL